MEGSNSGQGIT